MALASQLLVSEWLLAKSILGKKYGTRTKRDINTIVPWLRDRGEIFTSLSDGTKNIPIANQYRVHTIGYTHFKLLAQVM